MILTTFLLFLTKSVACNAYTAAFHESLDVRSCVWNVAADDYVCAPKTEKVLDGIYAACEASLDRDPLTETVTP